MRPSLLAAVVCAIALNALAADANQWKPDYDTLQKWQYSTEAIVLTQPVTITRDTATWTLRSGSVRLAEPTSSGRTTGLIFDGDGRFTMTVPDRFELAQLRRFTEKPQLESIDEPFSQAVIRVSDDTIDKLFPNAKRGTYARNADVEKRQNHWLIDLTNDVDARIVTAMANGGMQMTAGMKTADFDWLTYNYDSTDPEEITLTHWSRGFPESWLSLDRAEDRAPDGRPGTHDGFLAKLSHIDVKADLTKLAWSNAGATQQRLLRGHYVVAETLTAQQDGVVALPLRLTPYAQSVTAADEKGNALPVLRDHIGGRGVTLDKRMNDPLLTVIFPAALKKGEARTITFGYDLETSNYAAGDVWYPTVPDAFDAHTARLELLVNKKNAIRAMGKKVSETEDDRGKTAVYVVERPTMMITFATAEGGFAEEKVDVKGIPQIVSFGAAQGWSLAARMHNAAADVANSMQFYQNILGDPIGGDTFYVTSITGNHGQAFDGFLHLSEFSYEEHPGASELFRAHEVAHEWFGHRVGWKSYRDQWLSESLAEYAAMLFVQYTVKGGDKYFDEILTSYEGIVNGNMAGGFSKFNRPWLIERNAGMRGRLGPIADGYRASTADIPAGYQIQAYIKGPLVLHMLRSALGYKTGNDNLFMKILSDFVHDYSGKLATTADFEKTVEKDAPGDWSWFFNDWVYRADIPTIRWSYRIEQKDGKQFLSVTVKRSGVPQDFVMYVPVGVEADGGKSGVLFVPVKNDEQTVTRELSMKPRNVIFAPGHSLLANIRRE